MNTTVALSYTHEIFFSNKEAVPADQVARSLLALSRMAARVPRLMNALVPQTGAASVGVYVEKIQSGSLLEKVIVTFFFKDEKKMLRALRRWSKQTGVDLSKASVMKPLLIILLAAGGGYALRALSTTSTPAQPQVQISNSVIIDMGAQKLGLAKDVVIAALDRAVTRKADLAKDVIDFGRPLRREPGSTVAIDGQEENLDEAVAQVLRAMPDELPAVNETTSRIVEKTEISLRAFDLDSGHRGWAAVVAAVSPRRLRVELAETVRPSELFGRLTVRGTVEVISRRDAAGRLQVSAYRIVDVQPDDGAP